MNNLSKWKTGATSEMQHPYMGMRHQLNKAMHDFYDIFARGDTRLENFQNLTLSPAMDLVEEKERFSIQIEMPGIEEKDVRVSVHGNILSIHAQKTVAKRNDTKSYVAREISYGEYTRNVSLPPNADINRITASFDKGMLMISIPKLQGTKDSQRHIKLGAEGQNRNTLNQRSLKKVATSTKTSSAKKTASSKTTVAKKASSSKKPSSLKKVASSVRTSAPKKASSTKKPSGLKKVASPARTSVLKKASSSKKPSGLKKVASSVRTSALKKASSTKKPSSLKKVASSVGTSALKKSSSVKKLASSLSTKKPTTAKKLSSSKKLSTVKKSASPLKSSKTTSGTKTSGFSKSSSLKKVASSKSNPVSRNGSSTKTASRSTLGSTGVKTSSPESRNFQIGKSPVWNTNRK